MSISFRKALSVLLCSSVPLGCVKLRREFSSSSTRASDWSRYHCAFCSADKDLICFRTSMSVSRSVSLFLRFLSMTALRRAAARSVAPHGLQTRRKGLDPPDAEDCAIVVCRQHLMHWKLPEWHGLLVVSGVADRVDLEGELIGVEGAAEEAAFGVSAIDDSAGIGGTMSD